MIEFDVPFHMISPRGTWTWNAADGGPGAGVQRFLLDTQNCHAGTDLRLATDHVPQADGDIVHRHLRSGYAVRFTMELWYDEAPAFLGNKVAMWDVLQTHLTAIIDPSQSDLDAGICRLIWTPSASSGGMQRMLDRIQLLEPVTPSIDAQGLVTVAFAIHSPFPYEMDYTQTTTTINSGFSATITNGGSCSYYPVFKVYGPTSAFTLTNSSTGLAIVYDSTLPGAASIASGHYVEINTFRNTAYLDGNGANLKAGINIPQSDFWQLAQGSNIISITGANVDILWQNAWA